MKRSQALLDLDRISDGILITNAARLIEYVNPALVRLFGYSATQLLGKNPKILQSGRHDAAFYRPLWQTLAKGNTWSGEIWNRHRNGEVFPQAVTIYPIVEPQQEAQEAAIRYLALYSAGCQRDEDIATQRFRLGAYDPLTGLPSLALFMDRLHYIWAITKRHGSSFCLLHITLYGLDAVEQLFDLATGDCVLCETATRLQNRIREIDIVARLSRHEFLLVFTESKERKDIEFMLKNVLAWLQMPHTAAQGRTVTVEPAIGIVQFPEDVPPGTKPGALFALAKQSVPVKSDQTRFRFYSQL